MHTLFSSDVMLNYGNMLTPRHERLKDFTYLNLTRAQDYFRRGNFAVQNQHILVKLLKSIKLPTGNLTQLSAEDVRNYYDEVRLRDYRLGNSAGLITSTSHGTIRKSDFYPNTVMEIVIGTSTTYTNALLTPWQDLEPVQVHRHPYDTTNYGLLDKRQIMGGRGIAVLSINIPLLALQWLKFNQWVAASNMKTTPTVNQFIAAYPIQNMVKSHNDIALINRTIKAYRGIKGHDLQPRQAFWLHDDMPLADMVLDSLIPELKRTPRYFENILLHMPTVTRSGYDAIRLPIDLDMRQNRWAWIIARTWLIDFLLEVEYSFNRGRLEGTIINQIKKELQVIKSDNTFNITGLPLSIRKTVNGELVSIAARMKNK